MYKAVIPFLIVLSISISACGSITREGTPVPTKTLKAYVTSSPNAPTRTPVDVVVPQTSLGPTPTPFVHIIQSGDTLLGISVRYGVELEDLLIANPGVDPGFLTLGEELFIPGPGGETPGSLIPTPTPVPLEFTAPDCYADRLGGTWCILKAENPSGKIIEDISGVLSAFSERRESIESQLIFGAANLLPSGGAIPLLGRFEHSLIEIETVRFRPVSAIQLSDFEERYLSTTITPTEILFGDDNGASIVEGEYSIERGGYEGAAVIRIVGIAQDELGQPIGLTRWEREVGAGESDGLFDLTIFSLGPPITEIEFLAETQRLD